MREEKLSKLLNELSEKTSEAVNPGLAEDIKHRIPRRLVRHKGMDTVNIIIDLRVGKLAAAAVIILTMILCASFLGGRDTSSGGIYQDGRMLVRYLLGGGGSRGNDVLAGKAEHLVHQGVEVMYYGESANPEDSNAILMHWKLSDGNYRVTFTDLRVETVGAEELIKLQARMLQKEVK